MHKENSQALVKFFVTGAILILFPAFVTSMWFHAASISIDAAEASAVFRNYFLIIGDIWVVILVSFIICLAVIYCMVRSMKHSNYWVKNFSLMIMFLAIIFAILDVKWLLTR